MQRNEGIFQLTRLIKCDITSCLSFLILIFKKWNVNFIVRACQKEPEFRHISVIELLNVDM